MDQINVDVKCTVAKPIKEVFEAVINPEKLKRYFVSHSNAEIKTGEKLIWSFDDQNVKLDIEVLNTIENNLIVFEWMACGVKTKVNMRFQKLNENETEVHIIETGLNFTTEDVKRAMGQTQGWTDFLCSLKAYLYCNINLRNGKKY